MSYVLDGKVANQSARTTMGGKVRCEKCRKLLDPPDHLSLNGTYSKSAWTTYSYVQRSGFIYESLCGFAVVYCSEYCRNKHNHRFTK
jgi:hypothetical protein